MDREIIFLLIDKLFTQTVYSGKCPCVLTTLHASFILFSATLLEFLFKWQTTYVRPAFVFILSIYAKNLCQLKEDLCTKAKNVLTFELDN